MAPAGKHVAIEVSPSKAKWLTKKFPHVRIEQIAISDSSGSAIFEENINNPGFSRLQSGRPSTERVHRYEVRVTTIDSLNFSDRVNVLKVDIEGHELAAFKGAVELVRRDHPAIIFECGAEPSTHVGSTRYQHPGLDRRQLFAFVTEQLGYDVLTFTDFIFNKGPLSYDEFRKCGLYPFRAFNFVALPRNCT
jgi:FkbM family methyltransferase